MISIVVGVNLIPSIVESINTAKGTANAPTGMSGLLDVLVGRRDRASLGRDSQMLMRQIRGRLSSARNTLIPSQALKEEGVETRRRATRTVEGIVQAGTKVSGSLLRLYSCHPFGCCGLDRRPDLRVMATCQ